MCMCMTENLVESQLQRGKTAVITGCNRGIGKATLEAFAKNGSNVFAVIRKENKEFQSYCQKLEEQYDVTIELFYADFSEEEEVKNVAKEILKKKKPIDVLVNNVGISNSRASLAMTRMSTIREAFQINLFSSLLLTQLVSKNMMRNKKGSIIFISSTAVYDAWSNIEYTTSKAAIVGAVRRLAIELGAYGIRVNSVAPALTNTDMAKGMSQEDEAIAVNRNIMKRKGEPEEIADVVIFLASDMSRFMTGQILRVDGGLLG